MSKDSVQAREEAYSQMNSGKKVSNRSGFHPLGRAVLVRPYEPASTVPSLIEIPKSIQDRYMMQESRAEVIEVGPMWVKDEPAPRCKPGDHVMISRMAGYMISEKDSLDGVLYRAVNHQDIFLIIDQEVISREEKAAREAEEARQNSPFYRAQNGEAGTEVAGTGRSEDVAASGGNS